MKLHIKLGVIFSSITVILILAFVLFSISFERNSLYHTSEEKLSAVGNRMVSRFDESIEMMDYTLKTLIADADFMEAMAVQTYMQPSSTENKSILLESQNLIANVLQRNPLNKNYHRVNAFNRDGLFSSSYNSLNALPDQIRIAVQPILSGMEWIDIADASPFQMHLLAPYTDPWTAGEEISVFGVARALVWMGQPCGYLEVQSGIDSLANIFSPEDLNGVAVCAFINNMQPIYESTPGTLQTALDYFERQEGSTIASHLYECDFSSSDSGLVLYISQDTTLWNQNLIKSLSQFALFAAVALLLTILIILLISTQLTSSVRVLEKSMQVVCFEHTSILPDSNRLAEKNEIYRIQSAFDSLIDRLNTSIHNEMQTRELHLQAQMNALQAQINPHFIYNTLNVITAKSLEHNALDIADVCDRFSNMLRYSTTIQERSVTLRQEVEHVTNYLELMKSRYEDRMHYTIEIPESLMNASLPKLTLQPLVENSFVHGYQNRLQTICISISAHETENGFVLTIHDNGDGFPEEILVRMESFLKMLNMGSEMQVETFGSPNSIGLGNTFTRLYIFCNGHIRFSLHNDNGAVVSLFIPKEMEET